MKKNGKQCFKIMINILFNLTFLMATTIIVIPRKYIVNIIR